MIDLSHPANAKILEYLNNPYRFYASPDAAALKRLGAIHAQGLGPRLEPADHSQPRGVHPDLASRLWKEVAADLPEPCAWIVHGAPALVHPRTGVIFGWAEGTHVYALRLPPKERAEAFAAGAKTTHQYAAPKMLLDVAKIGPEWVLGNWSRNETYWCLGAFRAAGAA